MYTDNPYFCRGLHVKIRASRVNSQSIEPYLLIAPLLVLLLVFILYPVVANIYLSFFKYNFPNRLDYTAT